MFLNSVLHETTDKEPILIEYALYSQNYLVNGTVFQFNYCNAQFLIVTLKALSDQVELNIHVFVSLNCLFSFVVPL